MKRQCTLFRQIHYPSHHLNHGNARTAASNWKASLQHAGIAVLKGRALKRVFYLIHNKLIFNSSKFNAFAIFNIVERLGIEFELKNLDKEG